MKCAELTETETDHRRDALRMPAGLLGFEHVKDYVLATNPDEHPFAWLHVQDDSGLAFVVVDPFLVLPAYQPDIPQADVEFLGLKSADDALLFGIVTLANDGRATMNLKGPIVVNRHTHTAKQVIIANANDYSVKHPLPVANAV